MLEIRNGERYVFRAVILETIREVCVAVRNVCGRLLTCRSDKSIARYVSAVPSLHELAFTGIEFENLNLHQVPVCLE